MISGIYFHTNEDHIYNRADIAYRKEDVKTEYGCSTLQEGKVSVLVFPMTVTQKIDKKLPEFPLCYEQ